MTPQRALFARRLLAIPEPVYRPLRKLRTVALWAAGPLDFAHRVITGQRRLPPLWLRRHVGPIPAFERAPGEITAILTLLGLLTPESTVLDIGCGSGAMVPDFQRLLGPRGRYVGFDVHAASVRWCQRHFADDPRLRFELARIATAYSEGSGPSATSYRFPADDGAVDLVLAKSVFTHMLEADARHYLAEIARVLAPDGRALISAFLLENGKPRPGDAPPILTFDNGDAGVRWAVAAKPTAAVAYERAHFFRMVAESGLAVSRVIDGYWSGSSIAPNAQDLLVLTRGEG